MSADFEKIVFYAHVPFWDSCQILHDPGNAYKNIKSEDVIFSGICPVRNTQ